MHFPAPPAFGESGFPAESEARSFVQRLLADVPPAVTATTLMSQPGLIPFVLRPLGMLLVGAEEDAQRSEIELYAITMAVAAARRLSQRSDWSQEDLSLLLKFQLIDPVRFVEEERFRGRVLKILPQMMEGVSPRLRDRQLLELNQLRNFDYEASETVEWGWKAIPRRSQERRLDWNHGSFAISDDFAGPIEASVYSLSSTFVSPEEAIAFLRAVRKAAPERSMIVLGDGPLGAAMQKEIEELRIHFIDTHGRPFTPWPRDPLLFSRWGGRVVLVARPNVQPNREEDLHMAREIVQGLSDELDRQWGGVRWTVAPAPFHNGQVLVTPKEVWISIHSLEHRILELLGLDRVPVASFSTETGLRTYWSAVDRAAAELASLYGRTIRFIHPRPAGDGRDFASRMQLLGGGAGFDLDSLLTLVPAEESGLQALVADITPAAQALSKLSPQEWRQFATTYGISPPFDRIASVLGRYQQSARATRLDAYLDMVAEHLAAEGIEVHRLPLLLVPNSLVAEADFPHQDFLLTWNNVVLEKRALATRAEGFLNGLPTLDSLAQQQFARIGAELLQFPPLRRSIILNGGYRCASNHSRPLVQ